MADRQPPAEQDDPEDVADHRADPCASPRHSRPPERPENIVRDPERRNAERDRDDQDERDEPGKDVGDRQPDAAQHQPDHIEDHAHLVPPRRGLPPTPAPPVQTRPSNPSSPTVRPRGSEAMPRTAISTPGMNEALSRESCLIVSVSPCPPSSTSWCATRPASRTECTCTPSTTVPRAPSSCVVVASGLAPRPAAARAPEIIAAVLAAVPDGASTLPAWCSSTTSAESKNRAACSANLIISTAPIEKLGTTRTLGRLASASPVTPAEPPARLAASASLGPSKPEVPMTTFRPACTHQARFSITAAGLVKSTTTSHLASGSRESPTSTSAASSRSACDRTVWPTSEPILPLAPSTPTLITVLLLPILPDRVAGRRAVVPGLAQAPTAAANESASSYGPTTASAFGLVKIAPATACTSSRVMASMLARMSSTASRSG